MPDPDDDIAFEQEHYQKLDPRTREEVGGVLERAFRREEGREILQVEQQTLLTLVQETEEKAEKAEQHAQEAEEAARRSSELYALSRAIDDLEALQRWEADAASYRREAERFRQEAEHLRKYLPG